MINQLNLKRFEDIYDKTYNNILKYVVCECANISDVNDIVQDIYLELYKKINEIDEIINIEAYLGGIAKNKIKKYYSLLYKIRNLSLNKENSREEEFLDNVPSSIDIEKIVIRDIDIEFIWQYLAKKKVIISKIFFLYYKLDYTIKEIAQELNVGESYIKNNLYRTLKELQKLMGGDGIWCDSER